MNIKKIISIVLGVVAIVMIGFGVYIMNSSKYIFETALDNVFAYLTDKYMETDVLNYENFKLTTNNKATISSMELAKVDGEIYADMPNFNFYADVDSSIMGEEFIALEGLIQDDKAYLKVKEIMNRFYYQNMELPEELKEIDYKQIKLSRSEVELLFTYLKDSILKDLTDKDFEKLSETIAIENKNYKTTKIELKVTSGHLSKTIENFLRLIVNDNKAIQALQKIDKNITKNDVQKLLDTIDETNDTSSSDYRNDEAFTFAFYLEGFSSLRRVELSIPEETLDSDSIRAGFKLDLFENSYKNATYLLSLYEGDRTEATFKVEYENKTKANLLFNLVAEEIKIEGTMYSSGTTENIKLSLISEGQNLGSVDYTYTVVQENREYKIDIIVDISSMVIITSNNTLLLNEDFPEVNIKNARPAEDMSENEREKLEKYLEEKSNILNGFNEKDDDYL